MNPMLDSHTDLRIAMDAAAKAVQLIASRWDQDLNIERKGVVDLVTEVDRAAEAVIVNHLRAECPNDTIIGEEGGAHHGSTGRVWYIDPLDGTTNFSHGFPHFCASIGLWVDGVPSVGVVAEPMRNWYFSAVAGFGTFLNGRRLQVSSTDTINDALLATGFPYDRWTNPDNNSHRLTHMLRRSQGIRRAGAAALDLAYTAAGWLDGYWEDRLNAWDVAAGIILVQEAGGKLTDFSGKPIGPDSPSFVVANPRLHEALLREVGESDRAFGLANEPEGQ